MRLSNIWFLVSVKFLSCKVLHFFLEIAINKCLSQDSLCIALLCISLPWLSRSNLVLVSLHLLVIDPKNLFEALIQFLAHLRLQFLETFVQFDLGLQICFLPVALCNLLVLFIACLEEHVLVVVSQSLHREDGCSNLTVSFDAWDDKHCKTNCCN